MNDGSQQPAAVAPLPEAVSVVAHEAHTQQARSEPHDDPVQQSAETGGSGPSSTSMSLARAGSAPTSALPQQQISVTVQHRAKAASLLSPSHFVHIPRQFFHTHFDVSAILRTGINLQLETNGQVQTEIKKVAVASYTNTSGHTYFRLLGFKPMCRHYTGWRIDKWTKVNEDTLRLCISGPHMQVTQELGEQQDGTAGADGAAGSAGPSGSQGVEGSAPDTRGSGSGARGRATRAGGAGTLATKNSDTSGGRAGQAITPKRPADEEEEQKGGRQRGKMQVQPQQQVLHEPAPRSQQPQRSQPADGMRIPHVKQEYSIGYPQLAQQHGGQAPQQQQSDLPWPSLAVHIPSATATELMLQQLQQQQQQASAPRTLTTISSMLGAQGANAWQQPQQQQPAYLETGVNAQPSLSLVPWQAAAPSNQNPQQQSLAQLLAGPQNPAVPQLQVQSMYQPVLQGPQLQQQQFQQQQQLMMMQAGTAAAAAAQPLSWPMATLQEGQSMGTATTSTGVNVASAPQLFLVQTGTGQAAMLVPSSLQGTQHVLQEAAYSQPVLSGLVPAMQLQQVQPPPPQQQQQVMFGAPLTLMQGVGVPAMQQLLDLTGQQLQLAAAQQALTAPQQQMVAGVTLQPGGQPHTGWFSHGQVYHLQTSSQQPPQQ